jgi:hypothetical protein
MKERIESRSIEKKLSRATKSFGRVSIVIMVCLFDALFAHGQNEEEQARKTAEEAVKIGAIDYLTDREFKLDGPQIAATARALNPKEHVKIELKEFELGPGSVRLKANIVALFRFEGKVTVDKEAKDVRGEANVGQLVTIEAQYWIDNTGLHVDAKATEMKFSAKVRELVPEDAAGGKAAFGKLVLKQLGRQKEAILREFNNWQQEYQRRMR